MSKKPIIAPLYDVGRVTFRTEDGHKGGYIVNMRNPQIMEFSKAPQWGYDGASEDDDDVIVSITGYKSGKWNYAVRDDDHGILQWVQEDDVVEATPQEHDGYFVNTNE